MLWLCRPSFTTTSRSSIPTISSQVQCSVITYGSGLTSLPTLSTHPQRLRHRRTGAKNVLLFLKPTLNVLGAYYRSDSSFRSLAKTGLGQTRGNLKAKVVVVAGKKRAYQSEGRCLRFS
jgi:hypothetical protein